MIYVEVSEKIQAPRDEVFALNADFRNWSSIFPDVSAVRLIRERYDELIFEVVDRIRNEKYIVVQRMLAPEKIVREIRKRTLNGKASYTLKSLEGGTYITFTMNVTFNGYYKLLAPFIKNYVRKRLATHFLEPLKRAAEAKSHMPTLEDHGIPISLGISGAFAG